MDPASSTEETKTLPAPAVRADDYLRSEVNGYKSSFLSPLFGEPEQGD